eukprot:354873-Chlamydomonas_euryale.AAC.3
MAGQQARPAGHAAAERLQGVVEERGSDAKDAGAAGVGSWSAIVGCGPCSCCAARKRRVSVFGVVLRRRVGKEACANGTQGSFKAASRQETKAPCCFRGPPSLAGTCRLQTSAERHHPSFTYPPAQPPSLPTLYTHTSTPVLSTPDLLTPFVRTSQPTSPAIAAWTWPPPTSHPLIPPPTLSRPHLQPGGPSECDYRVDITTGPNSDSKLEVGKLHLNILGNKGDTKRQPLDLPQVWGPGMAGYGNVGRPRCGCRDGRPVAEVATGHNVWFARRGSLSPVTVHIFTPVDSQPMRASL